MEDKENVIDDLFDAYIEYDPDGIDFSEKSSGNKPLKARKEQFNLITAFMKENDESVIGTDKFNEMWDRLTIELNDAGPPLYTTDEWKRKWIAHKYNVNKRKRNRNVPLGDETSSKILRRDLPSSSTSMADVLPIARAENELLDVIIKGNNDMIQKLDAIIERLDVVIAKLEMSMNLLQEFVKQAKK